SCERLRCHPNRKVTEMSLICSEESREEFKRVCLHILRGQAQGRLGKAWQRLGRSFLPFLVIARLFLSRYSDAESKRKELHNSLKLPKCGCDSGCTSGPTHMPARV